MITSLCNYFKPMSPFVESKIKSIRLSDIVLVFDFDGTLNKKHIGTKKVPSIISILRNENILNDDYAHEAHALANIYYPIELDPNIPKEIKIQKTEEWWKKAINLLIKHNLSLEDIRRASYHQNLVLREGCLELLSFANEKNIPIVIFSASGTGVDSIRFFLERYTISFPNITIISNRFEYKDNVVNTIIPPLIHTLNKNESILKFFPDTNLSEKRSVILVGDSINDVDMVLDSNHDTVIRIGLCNEIDPEEKITILPKFQENFDFVIEDDGSLLPLYNLLVESIN